jgi:DNA repair exonuclease SbcCD nuclease subunit
MRFLIFGDLQASDGHERCFHDPTIPLQRWRVNQTLDLLARLYKDHGCHGLIDLGDTTDDRQAIPIPTIHAVLKPLERFKGGHNIKLMGNHEQWLKSTSVHPGVMYSHIFKVVENAEVLKFGDVAFACVSYIDDHELLEKSIKEVVAKARKSCTKVVLLGHFSMAGASAHGMTLDDGLDTEDIPKIDMGFLGHIHKHQEIRKGLFYVGSPFQQDFGETNEKKYVAILDTDSMSVEWIDTGMPQYRRMNLEQFKASVREDQEDRYEVRLASFEESKKFYEHPLSNRAIPQYDYIQSSPNQSAVETERKVVQFDVKSLMTAYVDTNPPKEKGLQLESEELIDFGNELIAQ